VRSGGPVGLVNIFPLISCLCPYSSIRVGPAGMDFPPDLCYYQFASTLAYSFYPFHRLRGWALNSYPQET